ncbi:MAG: molybdopterin-dependent oxidoreductase [Coriobacteriales bacterium]|nr:molybdopterin-dependent oxidoreductase [Coriobacteriales bacterium]
MQERKAVKFAPQEFGRRSFLKGAAATAALAGATALVPGCAPRESGTSGEAPPAAAAEQIFQGICAGDCGGGCGMNVHVRDGKVVKTSKIDLDDPLMTRVCQRGLAHAQRVYAPERIKYPMRRAGERGEDTWEQITWDEAIEEVCTHWKAAQEAYGPGSVAFFCGTGNQGPDQYYVARLRTAMGATNIMGSSDMNGLYMAALMVTRGPYLHGSSFNTILDSKNIFLFSCNSTTSNHVKWSYVLAAKDKGAKLVVIDPNYTVAASKADIWVPLRPGTDAALYMAMTNVIIDEGLADIDYLTRGTVAPYLVKESDGKYLRYSDIGLAEASDAGAGLTLDGAASQQAEVDDGSNPIVVMGADGVHGSRDEITEPVIEGSFEVEGVAVKTAYTLLRERIAEWTVDHAAELCELDPELIREVARVYADGPTMNYPGFGMDHWVQGPWPYHALFAMAFVAGNFGKPGASVDGSMQANMGITGVNVGAAMMFEGAQQGFTLYSQQVGNVLETGQWMGFPLTIKCLFSYMSNPCASLPDRNAWMKFIDTLDHFVVVDSVMSDTVRMADLVLPSPHWFEVETFYPSVLPTVRISEQAIAPLYESKSDIDIANLLGVGMGLADIMNMTADDFHSICLDNEMAAELGLSWDALKEEKSIQVLPDDFIFGENYTLPTPTGKAEFYVENVAPMIPYGQVLDERLLALPHWEAPSEAWPTNPLYEKYPLTLMTYRDKARVNTMFCYSPWLEEIFPEPMLDINPADAEARGIANGDEVRVLNDRGFMVVKARVNPAVRPGFVETVRASNKERYIEGHYATLPSTAYNDLVNSNGFNDCLVEVAKA